MDKKIKMLVMDVDGTLTDGQIYIGNHGEMMKAFHVKDGLGIVEAKKKGILPVIITGRKSDIVSQRCKELGIEEVHQAIQQKCKCLEEIAQKYSIQREEIAYIGDDINDLECIKYCGISACPVDAVREVKKIVTYICESSGGKGAVREFLEWIYTC